MAFPLWLWGGTCNFARDPSTTSPTSSKGRRLPTSKELFEFGVPRSGTQPSPACFPKAPKSKKGRAFEGRNFSFILRKYALWAVPPYQKTLPNHRVSWAFAKRTENFQPHGQSQFIVALGSWKPLAPRALAFWLPSLVQLGGPGSPMGPQGGGRTSIKIYLIRIMTGQSDPECN